MVNAPVAGARARHRRGRNRARPAERVSDPGAHHGRRPTSRRARVAGTLFAGSRPRLVEIKGIQVEADFAPHMLYVTNQDKPGFIGRFGATLAGRGDQHRHVPSRPRRAGRRCDLPGVGGRARCRRTCWRWCARCRWWCRRRRWRSEGRGKAAAGALRPGRQKTLRWSLSTLARSRSCSIGSGNRSTGRPSISDSLCSKLTSRNKPIRAAGPSSATRSMSLSARCCPDFPGCEGVMRWALFRISRTMSYRRYILGRSDRVAIRPKFYIRGLLASPGDTSYWSMSADSGVVPSANLLQALSRRRGTSYRPAR